MSARGSASASWRSRRATGGSRRRGGALRKDGTKFWANVLITAVHNGAGELVGFTKVTRDLTERRRLQEEQLSLARAQEAIRLRDEFLALASHELKTPLTVLQIQLDSLRNHPGTDDPKLATKLDRAARSSDRLTRLVGSLLDVSRIATGKFALDPKPFDLGESLGRLVDRMRPAAAAAGCELSLTSAGPLEGVWDQLRVEQVVTNLVANAIKYAAGTPIEVDVRGDGAWATIRGPRPRPGDPRGRARPDLRPLRAGRRRSATTAGWGSASIWRARSSRPTAARSRPRDADGGGALFEVRLPQRKAP